MTEGFQVFLLGAAAIGAALTAAGSFVSILVSLRNGRTARGIVTTTEAAREVLQEIKVTINGRLDELLSTTRALAHVEGAAAARATDRIDPAVTALAAASVLSAARDLTQQPKPDQP